MATKIILIGYCFIILCCSILADGDKIGVNYGMDGDNLPSPGEVVTLMKSNNMGKMKIFQANRDVLKAFANSGIDVIVGVGNTELQKISSSQDAANGWVNDNIRPFYPATNIKYIAVGNEVLTGATQYASYLVPAMRNIQTAIQNANLQNNIKVSTTHASGVTDGYPPSKGVFRDTNTMSQILKFLSDNRAPLMANIYPYFSYTGNRGSITLDYALFKSTSTVVADPNSGLNYNNLFDALVDTFLSAMGALGYPNLPLIVTESGWPSGGEDVATVDNARTYNNNLVRHVLSNAGTPKRPGSSIETYIFALFNENRKSPEYERNFGLFYPNKQPVYSVNFSP